MKFKSLVPQKVTAILESYLKSLVEEELKGLVNALHHPEEFFNENNDNNNKNNIESIQKIGKESKRDKQKRTNNEVTKNLNNIAKKKAMEVMKAKCKEEFILR